jgi:CelD/BcsL family acetyltransferase involved in cellulose biosynthesis
MKARVIRPDELDANQIARWRLITSVNDLYRSPYYSPHFAMSVARARSDARVAILEDAGETIGFFPFHRLRSGVAKPIGGPICDYQGPIIDSRIDLDPQTLLRCCALSSYDFNHLPVAMKSLSADAYNHTQSHYADLSHGVDAYTEARRKVWKKVNQEVTRCIRKAGREVGEVEFTYHDASDETYAEHVAHKNKMFARVKVASALNVGWVNKALDTIRRTQNPEFSGVMTTVRVDGRLMSAHFGMRTRTDWHWWFPSYDPEFANFGPGIMLIHYAVTNAEEFGVKRIDFGRGESMYKNTFSNGTTPLCEGSIELRATRAGMLRTGQKAVLRSLRQAPLGRMESYPRRAFSRLISGMRLPSR